jgi:hypothetical protein
MPVAGHALGIPARNDHFRRLRAAIPERDTKPGAKPLFFASLALPREVLRAVRKLR